MNKKWIGILSKSTLALAISVSLPLSLAAPALAGVSQPGVVTADPVNWTPDVNNGAIYKMVQSGSTLYAVGKFTSVTKGATVSRQNLVAFDSTTGALRPLSISVNDSIWTVVHDGASLYIGGNFTTVNGVERRGIAKINPSTGVLDTTFNAQLGGNVSDAVLSSGRLIIAGTFTKKLQAVNPTTGTDTGYINLGINGSVASNAGPVQVYRIAISPNGTRLMAIGNFTTVAGTSHYRAFMVNLGNATATANPWNYQPLAETCAADSLPDYLRDVDFSPDGSYFVIVSTGAVSKDGQVGSTLCDATARFETNTASPSRPTWINYTGGDTLHSVNVTGAAIYVQGHQRWLNNPEGRDFAGPGAVSRPGIGAINPSTGLALSWNPTKARGVGGKDLLATPAGLWVGSDSEKIGGETHKRIAFFPL